MILTKLTQTQVTALAAIIVWAILGLYHFGHDQGIGIKSVDEPLSIPPANLTAASIVSAAPIVTNDSNWAGYIIASDIQNPQALVTTISASWTVPTVTISSLDTFSAAWIGIGGYFDSTLIQVGTEHDSVNGADEYFAWFELLPDSSIAIDNIVLSPGDQINASIQLINSFTDEWSVTIRDLTTNQQYQNTFFYPSSQLSAEWIVERPTVGRRLSNLTDIGTVKFTNCKATIGTSGTISSFPGVQSIMYESVQNTDGITQLTAVSDLADNGSSFTVETSASAIPESFTWALLPIITATALFAAITKKCRTRKRS